MAGYWCTDTLAGREALSRDHPPTWRQWTSQICSKKVGPFFPLPSVHTTFTILDGAPCSLPPIPPHPTPTPKPTPPWFCLPPSSCVSREAPGLLPKPYREALDTETQLGRNYR